MVSIKNSGVTQLHIMC